MASKEKEVTSWRETAKKLGLLGLVGGFLIGSNALITAGALSLASSYLL